MEVIRSKIEQILQFFHHRYQNNQENIKIDIIRGLLLLGLILSWFHENWVDYLTVSIPFLRSVRAVETSIKADDTFWIKYWLIFSLFKIVFDRLLPFVRFLVPGFDIFRLLFFYYCGSYRYQGADVVYQAIKDYLLRGVAFIEGLSSTENE